MKAFRVIGSTVVVFLFLLTCAIPAVSQTGAQGGGAIPKTHRFQPSVPPNSAEATPRADSANTGGLSSSAMQQIETLEQEKQSRTPIQKKISSRLIYTARMLRGEAAAPGIPVLYTNLELDEQNNLFVDIKAVVSDNLLQKLRELGVRIIRSEPNYRSIRAFVSPYQLEAVAGLPEVKFISPRSEAMTVGERTDLVQRMSRGRSPGFVQRANRVREQLSAQLANIQGGIVCPGGQGSQFSEGYDTHRVNDACGTFGVAGTGVKIGVLSDGVANLAASQALGDLPPTCPAGPPCVTVLDDGVAACIADNSPTCDEGTAMMEIIHDLAPGANLYFATAFTSIESFAQNIRDLRTAGCDIIVDDVIYFVETPFQDGQDPSIVSTFDGGVVSQAINDVTADGAMYFSSAGNEFNKDGGESGTFEGDFVDGGANSHLTGGTVAKFGTTAYDAITFAGGPIILHWADPLGGSNNDYDLFRFNSTGTTVLDFSTDLQDGTQDPIEGLSGANAGDRIVVFKATAAAARFFHMVGFGASLAVTTQGAIAGHAGSTGAFAVAATPAHLPICGNPLVCPTGPWPNPFDGTNIIEPFSSDGPRHIFFQGDGTPITPGNFTSTGGVVLAKPEFTAADGVAVTGAGGFPNPFYGTSAAAPHAAAIAGLVKSLDPTLTSNEIAGFMTNSAIDIMGAGTDRNSGVGIVMAFQAVKAATAPRITTLSPLSGDVGTPVTISGKNFGATADTVTFNGTAATPTTWSDTSIVVPVPVGAANGNVVVTVGGVASNGVLFTLTPHITSVNPNSGTVGLPVTITGTNFGNTQGSNTVKFNGTTAAPTTWSSTSIVVPVPNGVSTGNVVVTINGIASNGVLFTFVPPAITSLSTNLGPAGTAVTITGTSFGPAQGASTVKFNGTAATVTTWSDTSLTTTVPAGATTGNVVVTVNSTASNGLAFTVQDFAFQAALTDITVTAGLSASEDFTVNTPDGFTGTITFSCTGLPDKSSCAFTPASITPGANTTTTVTMKVSTTAAITTGVRPGMFGLWLPLGGMGLVLAGMGSSKRRRKALAMLGTMIAVPVLLAIVSCGGGGSSHTTTPGTPPGSYTITMKATSSPTTHSATFKLNVN
ncbi:MAG: IPT/TIG domain-containing protein [Acidobacteria bacterium]|nr:IPT/TIG domain-containing protein [Acidobacteriota bacterium]